jgi:hypothetical protein
MLLISFMAMPEKVHSGRVEAEILTRRQHDDLADCSSPEGIPLRLLHTLALATTGSQILALSKPLKVAVERCTERLPAVDSDCYSMTCEEFIEQHLGER